MFEPKKGYELKILHVSPTSFNKNSIIGGGERYLNYIVSAVGLQGANSKEVEQGILSLTDESSFTEQTSTVDGLFIQGNPHDVGTIDASALRTAIERYDIVHVHQCLSNFGLFVAAHAKSLRRATIGTDHGGGESTLLDWNPSLAAVFDRFHAQSNFSRLGFARFSAPVETILGPINEDQYRPRESHPTSRYIVSAGRIMPHKGFDQIIKIIPQDLHYIIAGQPYDQQYLEYLSRMADTHNKNVKFVHDADDERLKQLITGSMFYVQPSVPLDYRRKKHKKSELLGLACLEALAMGVPVVANGQTALGELGDLTGVFVYSSIKDCRTILTQLSCGSRRLPPPAEIRTSMIEKYGRAQFHHAYTQLAEEIL